MSITLPLPVVTGGQPQVVESSTTQRLPSANSSPSRYYAVQKGWNKGVYDSWRECKAQVTGVRYAKFRKFENYEEAKRYAFPELYPLDSVLREEEENDHGATSSNKSSSLESRIDLVLLHAAQSPSTSPTTSSTFTDSDAKDPPLTRSVPRDSSTSDSDRWIKHNRQCAQELQQNTLNMRRYLETFEPVPVLPTMDRRRRHTENDTISPPVVMDTQDIDVWISVTKRNGGMYALYFDKTDPRNSIGRYAMTGTTRMTRLRLYACIRALHVVAMHLSSGAVAASSANDTETSASCETRQPRVTNTTLVVHTETGYLLETLTRWSAGWYSHDKSLQWARQYETDATLLQELSETSTRLGIKLLPVSCNVHGSGPGPRDGNMTVAKSMLPC